MVVFVTVPVCNVHNARMLFVPFHCHGINKMNTLLNLHTTHTHTFTVSPTVANEFSLASTVCYVGRRGHSMECSTFIIPSSLLDKQDKWETSRGDMNSKMHFSPCWLHLEPVFTVMTRNYFAFIRENAAWWWVVWYVAPAVFSCINLFQNIVWTWFTEFTLMMYCYYGDIVSVDPALIIIAIIPINSSLSSIFVLRSNTYKLNSHQLGRHCDLWWCKCSCRFVSYSRTFSYGTKGKSY